ncbi:uncharacterized protein LOC131859184 [Cryptomeria japonica]|uniref:uncharacterized protein LOC131859184 n=1 Tax=Cryptomeria japonica TaxID=3369 RepID=UPI0027DAA61C|nr:uncharacterized protein LOC131859184 [Cryptomeria japonica]
MSNKEDTLRWCGSKSGQYSFKIGYGILENLAARVDYPTKLLWSSPILSKAGAFSWLVLRKRILTRERLCRLGFLGPFRCTMCKSAEETLDHLLLQCEEAQKVRKFLLVWEICKERNRRIFQDKSKSEEKLCARVEREIAEAVSVAARNHNLTKHSFTNEERDIQANWPMIHCQPINGSSGVDPVLSVEKVKWEPPSKQWIKINFDGASKENLGTLSVGVVARDDN